MEGFLVSVRRIVKRKRPVLSQRPQHNDVLELFQAALRVLATANSGRRKVLSIATFVRMLQAVAAGKRVSWAWSSWTTHGYGRGYPATIALCFRREDGCVVFGASEGRDKCNSPGRAWTELRPWRPGTTATTHKLDSWAKQVAADRLRVPGSLLVKIISLLLHAAKSKRAQRISLATEWLFIPCGRDRDCSRPMLPSGCGYGCRDAHWRGNVRSCPRAFGRS
jgi:hypothetical protein